MKLQSQSELLIEIPATEDREQFPSSIDLSNREGRRKSRLWTAATVLVTALVLLAIYLLRLDPVVGQFKDDGWYVVLAKSLATGRGYNLINMPQGSGSYFYPPLFPFVLSLLYRLSPHFPDNVFLLKSLSICSMLLLPILVFRCSERRDGMPRLLAYLLASSAAAAPSFVMLATSSVMSEGLFTVLMFASLLVAERHSRGLGKYSEIRNAGFAAVLASACYLTRAIGVAVVAAVALYLLARRMHKPLAVFVAVSAICIGPWMFYQHSRALKNSRLPRIAAGYSSQFWDRYAGVPGAQVTARDLPARIWQVSTVMVGDDVGALIVPSFYRSGSESGEELVDMSAVVPAVSRNVLGMHGATMGLAISGQMISLGLSILIFIGFFASARMGLRSMELVFCLTLMILIVWPSSPMRYLVPLLPIFLYYFAVGIAQICRLIRRRTENSFDHWSASRVVMACVLAFFLYDNAGYVAARREPIDSFRHPDWLRQFHAIQQADTWVRNHTSSQELITSDNMPMTYLYTQRNTEWNDPDSCTKAGIRYYVNTEGVDLEMPAKVVFPTSHYAVQVVEISNQNQSPPQSRAAAEPYSRTDNDKTQSK